MDTLLHDGAGDRAADWTPVCRVDDIPVLGARRIARPLGIAVAVFRNAQDEVHALLDRCPHRGGPLSQGIVFARSVACPLHNWTIGLADGRAHAPDEGCVPRFACRVEGGAVMLSRHELATLATDLEPPRAGPCAASAGRIGDVGFDVQAPQSA